MDFNINTWLKGYLDELKALFGSRLLFVGLQGSYGRGEATDSSDIDAVVILDQVTPGDLKAYGAMLDILPNREKVCGFISGWRELETYIKQKAELIPVLQPQEREILQTGIMLKQQPNMAQAEFERLSELLFNWAAVLIIEYNIN